MKKRQRNLGATVIELIMAIVILSIALPPMIMAFTDAAMHTIQPTDATVASFLAIERMEEVIARRYRDAEAYEDFTVPTFSAFPDESPVAGYTKFTRTVRVSHVDSDLDPAGSDEGYKRVVVSVTWSAGEQSLVIERVFADFQP